MNNDSARNNLLEKSSSFRGSSHRIGALYSMNDDSARNLLDKSSSHHGSSRRIGASSGFSILSDDDDRSGIYSIGSNVVDNSSRYYDGSRPRQRRRGGRGGKKKNEPPEEQQDKNKLVYGQRTDRTTLLIALWVLFMWVAAVGIFLYFGVRSEINTKNQKFETEASEVISSIERTLEYYEHIGLWVHQHCSRRKNGVHGSSESGLVTGRQFRQMYEYILSEDRQVRIGWLPNLTHSERLQAETDSLDFLTSQRPDYNYLGITVRDETVTTGSIIEQFQARRYAEPQDFYFPLHLLEPFHPFLFDRDLYQSRIFRRVIDEALSTFRPVLLAPEARGFTWNARLLHPGVPHPSSTHPDMQPQDLAWVEVSLENLISQSAQNQNRTNLAVYLYDVTDVLTGEEEESAFLGGVVLEKSNSTVFSANENTTYRYEDILDQYSTLYGPTVELVGRSWTIVVVPLGGVYDPDLTFVVFGGGMIFVGSIFLALWLYHNYKRTLKLEEVKEQAKAESAIVASLFPEGIHDRLLEEQEDKQRAEKERLKAEKDRKIFKQQSTLATPTGIDASERFEEEDQVVTFRQSVESEARSGRDTSVSIFGSKPIADLFPDATIMFADLVGFTRWSSNRDPIQVFTLLETIYHSFDQLAKKRKIFKVETIGDCYVAVAGVPEPRKDHAVAMAKFAADCLQKMKKVLASLVQTLGPETANLNLRVGLHSGEVTAGVLRGDKGRFQLFGDTVNTAAKMESTSQPGSIHLSEDTANHLKRYNKTRWLIPRNDTDLPNPSFWLNLSNNKNNKHPTPTLPPAAPVEDSQSQCSESLNGSMTSSHSELDHLLPNNTKTNDRKHRLIQWNVDILADLLKQLVAKRAESVTQHSMKQYIVTNVKKTPLDEFKNVISFPKKHYRPSRNKRNREILLGDAVLSQLHKFITVLSVKHHKHFFHNFEHASHVLVSINKMLSQLTTEQPKQPEKKTWHEEAFPSSMPSTLKKPTSEKQPLQEDAFPSSMPSILKKPKSEKQTWQEDAFPSSLPSTLKKPKSEKQPWQEDAFPSSLPPSSKKPSSHGTTRTMITDHTFALMITDDPLTMFACAFAGIIHTVDHPGHTNSVLIKEHTDMAQAFRNRSIAQQNAINVGWKLLMNKEFEALRDAIYSTQEEFVRFRQLVVNFVISSDLMDANLHEERTDRWNQAFSKAVMPVVERHVKASVVLEHLMPACNYMHTMERWHIYIKWNERLFHERYHSYTHQAAADRSDEANPAETWYEEELTFLDEYMIPLAQKLGSCGAFGPSSLDYYNNALRNRQQWASKGKRMVNMYIRNHSKYYPSDTATTDETADGSNSELWSNEPTNKESFQDELTNDEPVLDESDKESESFEEDCSNSSNKELVEELETFQDESANDESEKQNTESTESSSMERSDSHSTL